MENSAQIHSVFWYDSGAFVLCSDRAKSLFVAPVIGGIIAANDRRAVHLVDSIGVFIDWDFRQMRMVCGRDQCYLTYVHTAKTGPELVIASGKTPELLTITHRGPYSGGPLCIVPDRKIKKHTLLFSGDGAIDVSFLDEKGTYIEHLRDFVIPQRHPHFYEVVHHPLAAVLLEDGIALFYDSTTETEKEYEVRIGLVYCDIEDLHTLLCRSEEVPYWSGRFAKKRGKPECVGAHLNGEYIHFYFLQGGELFRLQVSRPLPRIVPVSLEKQVVLDRHHGNPILQPNRHQSWESEGTFNPGVVEINDRVHVFYRAVGNDGVSRIGYANSPDGFTITERLDYPVLDAAAQARPLSRQVRRKWFPSGASSGGLEDPRAVKIGKRVYLTYSSFDHWDSIRMMMTSISVEDLLANRWKWSKPVALSPEKELHKNWVLFPEKIRGKYAIVHALSPSVLIEYVDSLSHFSKGKRIESRKPSGGRLDSWDNSVRGIGPPPIKTSEGWLVLYHATSVRDPHKYKLGAMLLDLEHPEKILYRSNGPVLEPEMDYENTWKPGVIYASGAVVRDGVLHVYYGGGDMVVAVATCGLNDLLLHLKNQEPYAISKIKKFRVKG